MQANFMEPFVFAVIRRKNEKKFRKENRDMVGSTKTILIRN